MNRSASSSTPPFSRREGDQPAPARPEGERQSPLEDLGLLPDDPSQLNDAATADDLLSKLADEEIDRMLAAAEEDDADPAMSGAALADDPATDNAEATSEALPPAPPEGSPLSDQLDRLFDQLEPGEADDAISPFEGDPLAPEIATAEGAHNHRDEIGDLAPPPPEVRAVTHALDQAVSDVEAPPEMEAEEPTAADEVSAELDAEAALRSAPEPPPITPRREAAPWRLPAWIEAVLSPLDFLPPRVRDVVGAVAILTLLNALVILIILMVWGPLQ